MTAREKKEIEDKLKLLSPFLKLEFLEKKLKQTETFDVKRFIHLKLAELYEEKRMFIEAARNIENAADIAITFREKREEYMKCLKIYIKAGDFQKTDIVFAKALSCGNEEEKKKMKEERKEYLREEAERLEKEGKNNNALKVYEVLFRILNEEEKIKLKEKLIFLYEKLGKIREANSLKGI